jgi:hypothetical protein
MVGESGGGDARPSTIIGLTWRIGEKQNASSTGWAQALFRSSDLAPSPLKRIEAALRSKAARRSTGFAGVIVDEIAAAYQSEQEAAEPPLSRCEKPCI